MKNCKFDFWLFLIVVLLLLIGILVLASVSAVFSQEKFGRTTYYLFHQLSRGLLPGIILGFLAFRTPLSFFQKWTGLFILINLIFMALVFIPGLGVVSGGATRWLNFGFVSFQPSEFLKLNFIFYLSIWLAKRKELKSTLLPFLIVVGIVALLLIFQSDASTLGIITLAAGLMYFSANTPLWHSLLILLMAGAGSVFLIKIASYRWERLLVFLNPETDPMGMGYQIKQALIAVGSGGIIGLGLGMSQQKFGRIPQVMSDSIFPIFAEETGFVGSLILILLFLLLLWRGFRIAKKSDDKFSQLFAIGFSSWICLQAFINIGSMISILPLTGIPLPFISYGGSHLVAELIGVGILLNISKSIKK
ncbi:MAG: putative lipid II flippase FtsW [Candidatus Nealsonbacteria bacterium]|nr:putative lipid II flippase FtsW [Candidatus Nealsonbacteria bacterium]